MPETPALPVPSGPADTARGALHDVDVYARELMDYVSASPSSYHAAAEAARRLAAAGFTALDETEPWGPATPRRGYAVRDGAIAAWVLPEAPGSASAFRIVGSHTDSPALKLKPAARMGRDGFSLIGAEVYGGPLLNSFLDRELGLAGRLVTRDGAGHLVRTGPIARVVQVAPHLDRSVNESLHLDRQAHLAPIWALGAAGAADDVEAHLCEIAGIERGDLAGHDILTYPTEAPARFGRRAEFIASSRLDNLSSVIASLVALESLCSGEGGRTVGGGTASGDVVVLVANDHEEVGSGTRSGAAGPFLEQVLRRLARALEITGEAYEAMLARSTCLSADAAHSVHPGYGGLHDPVVRPVLGGGPVLKINAQQRYATDAIGRALWERACAAAGAPHQVFVSNNAVPCGTTIGPITAQRLGITTADVGQPILSMHSQREMCAVVDGPWLAQALAAYWAGA
ncbi:M18 family aminopeptidase [Actinomyces gaoshouyii]|uniref:M18 family aminopeptidase n=1 Tax=Actinomyces gaoshouyii TaxID=1960083 RepID=UPI0009C03242|nr:M18 family aminopeptidase [Actinomyces gaoshouyii]